LIVLLFLFLNNIEKISIYYICVKNNPRVRIPPCNIRGQPKDKWMYGEMGMASITSESEKANQFLNQKYGLKERLIRTFNRLRNTKPIVCKLGWVVGKMLM
jgi:hypothetical protein